MPSVTINFSAAHGQRLQDALTEALDLDAPAGIDDLKQYIVDDLKQFVRTSERRVARKAISITDIDIT